MEAKVVAIEVSVTLAEVRAAVISDMAVDTAGRLSWWLTWLDASNECGDGGGCWG